MCLLWKEKVNDKHFLSDCDSCGWFCGLKTVGHWYSPRLEPLNWASLCFILFHSSFICKDTKSPLFVCPLMSSCSLGNFSVPWLPGHMELSALIHFYLISKLSWWRNALVKRQKSSLLIFHHLGHILESFIVTGQILKFWYHIYSKKPKGLNWDILFE